MSCMALKGILTRSLWSECTGMHMILGWDKSLTDLFDFCRFSLLFTTEGTQVTI